MDNSKTRTSRRNFLLTVGVGGAATVAAIAAKSVPQAGASKQKKDKKAGGYQLSEHVRSYYRTTLV